MTFVVPAVLGGLALAVMALVSFASARRGRQQGHRQQIGPAHARILVHSINDDRCTGCDACVAVCPTNVLDLVENKSRVLRFQDCIQCEACMWACPTTALVMHPEGTEPPPLRVPDLDEYYQTRVPGQYLIGEVAGKPLVKNAANLGRGVVEHMIARGGLRPISQVGGPRANRADVVDVAIVGSGPGGLAAALSCIQRGLTYLVLEKDSLLASTIARYPKGKLIMAEPYDSANLSLLPVFDSSKEETIPIWKDLLQRVGMNIRMNETVERVVRGPDGWFEVQSNVGHYRAQRVVLATGLRGKPRTLGCPGENLPKVFSLLEDPDNHRGQTVAVVGGGDSALEAAIALADAGAKVILTYRGRNFSRAQPKNRQTIESYEAQRRIKVKYQSEVVEFADDTVTLQMADGTQKRYPNQAAFILIGADPPIDWLATMGIHFVEKPHMLAQPKSDDLVRRYVRDAVNCPETAAGAAALVLGHEVAEELRQRPSEAQSRSKKWLRSATNIFTGQGKLERPMPLSEFAQQARKHSGRGRRDQLDARERTRVLRMLRDEGGRAADDDSKMFVIQRGKHHSETGRVEGSPPPAAPSQVRRGPPMPPPPPPSPVRVLAPIDTAIDDPLRTIPPTRGESAKPALIVGLARATAAGPRTGERRRVRETGPPDTLPPPVHQHVPVREEPTRQLGADDARRLFHQLEGERRASLEKRGARVEEDRTLEEPVLPLNDEPTRQVHLDLDAPVQMPVGSSPPRRRAGPSTGAHRTRPPAPAPSASRGPEESTRQVDLGRRRGEVDWDLE